MRKSSIKGFGLYLLEAFRFLLLTIPYPHQQKPYVIQQKKGMFLDKHGNSMQQDTPEVHIPLEEFIYRE
jgi:hypothetical protein